MNDCITVIERIIPMLRDLTLTVTGVVAAYVGLKGLGAWRQQLKGNTEYELAKQILKSVYELNQAISRVRCPFMDLSIPEKEVEGLSPEDIKVIATRREYQERWRYVRKAKVAFDTSVIEAKVIWKDNIDKQVDSLNALLGDLYWAIEGHLDTMTLGPGVDDEYKIENRKILYEKSQIEKDAYKARLIKTITEMENKLSPFIQQYHGKR